MIVIDIKIRSPQKNAVGKSVIEDGIIATTWNSKMVLSMMFKEIQKDDKTAKLDMGTIIQRDTKGRTDEQIRDDIIKDIRKLAVKFRRSMIVTYNVREDV